MNTTRRKLLQAGLVGGAALSAGIHSATTGAVGFNQRKVKPMRVLLLGGTGFIGPHMVREALRRGHEVTLFNRGKTNDELFPDLPTLIGDRDNDLEALKGNRWDVVIDNSGYVPRHVEDSARLLAKSADHYVFISTVSVYESFAKPIDEGSPLATLADETTEKVSGETYGALKALCEQRAASAFGADRLTILRPTYICGPGDHTDRFSYWPVRARRGGQMLWPGNASHKIQIVDVRDVANFTIDAIEQRIQGTYNLVTPAGEFTMGDLLADCQALGAADLEPVWVPWEFLKDADTGRGDSLPIWTPPQPDNAGSGMVSGESAVAKGMRNRNTRETARDTLSWWQTLPEERRGAMKAGLSPEIEARLLEDYARSVVALN